MSRTIPPFKKTDVTKIHIIFCGQKRWSTKLLEGQVQVQKKKLVSMFLVELCTDWVADEVVHIRFPLRT